MPDYVKLDDRVIEAIGKPRRAILDAIRKGTIKGKQFSPRDTRIDVTELPSSFFASDKTPTPIEPQVRHTSNDNPPTTTDLIQKTQDNIKLQKAQMEEIEIAIKLAEAQHQRDLPEIITHRDVESQRREEACKEREDKQNQREENLNNREKLLIEKEQNLIAQVKSADIYIKEQTDEANTILEDAKAYLEDKKCEGDEYYNKRVKDADTFDDSIEARRQELEELNTQVTENIKRITDGIQKWIKVADIHATQSYHIAQKASGNTERFHINRSNSLWGLKDKLQNIIKELIG